jgi:hypothetical protein
MPVPVLAMAAVFATLQRPSGASVALKADPCADVASLPADPSCAGAGPLCAVRDRARVACELRDTMRARYVFLDEKPVLLGGGGPAPRDRLDACVAAERAIPREGEPLHFFDRVRRCLAPLQDGHLMVSAPERLPQVALGVSLRRAGGRVVVAARDPGLRRLVGDAAADALPLGAEVLAIDGRPVEELAAELGRSVPASSAAARDVRALEALTRRDFDRPERRTAELTFLAGGVRGTATLPWWTSPRAGKHTLARGWAARTGIPETAQLPWFEEAVRPRLGAPAPEGEPAWASILPARDATGLREWADDGGRLAVRAGELARAGRPVCYLQILTFHSERLASAGTRRPFPAVIDEFVHGCAARGEDLVLDLRRNEGGYLDHSTAVAEALAPAGAADPGAALLVAATEWNEAVYRERSRGGPGEGIFAPGHVLDAIVAARRAGHRLSPAFVSPPLAPSDDVGGFPGKVVALTSPACMSACDRLAALLHASGRAVLVGGPTEGAGGSQQETGGLPARWTDSHRLLSVSIPNATFGAPRVRAGAVVPAGGDPAEAPAAVGAHGGEIPTRAFFEGYGIENRPVEPDVRYETRVDDVTGENLGWLEAADRALGAGSAPAAPTTTARREGRAPPGEVHRARPAAGAASLASGSAPARAAVRPAR